ncbi:MAG: sensor histidine kinase [Eubacteriales bacterium]|nr:sensor histidine kinase [Eubacteriales bacterium]
MKRLPKMIRTMTYLFLGLTVFSVLAVTFFIQYTTGIICESCQARDFLKQVDAIPWDTKFLSLRILFCLAILLVSFFIRSYCTGDSTKAFYALILLEFGVSMAVVALLHFNYNGIILWSFANIISHKKKGAGLYLFSVLGSFSYGLTDYGILAVSRRLFSVQDYIEVYDAWAQPYLLASYKILMGVNILVFILYCVLTIQDERGTIEEANELYRQLSRANEDLRDANRELEKYAVMKEKMGETKERNRLAREIHDTLGHTLTGIATGLEACKTIIEIRPEAARQQLELLENVTREGLTEVRRSVNQLRPDALARFSLENAIRRLVDNTNSVSDAEVEFICMAPILKFDEDEENAIYRVVQEGITNAIRHGHAKHIRITLRKEDGNIHLNIRDDGQGCQEIKPGFGTQHITERIRMLNGNVHFDGSDGFTIDAIIPIRWGETYD